jgi:putative transposase
MQVHRSGYYQWLNQPISDREVENQGLLVHIKEAFKASNKVYGYRNIHKDLKELGFNVNKKRVARLMSEAKLYGVGTYKRKPYSKPGPAHKAYTNHLH